MRTAWWGAVAAIAVILSGLIAAAVYGPVWLRAQAIARVGAETGRTLTIGEVSINPLALTVEIRDVALSEADRVTPFVTWQRLFLSFSPSSLWHRAPVLREIRLDQPTLRVERLADGSFNFSPLFKPAEPSPAATGRQPARFSLNNLVVSGGRIEFVDRTPARPLTHRIEQLELAVPFVGNLPYLADRYVQPHLGAVVNGARFALDGRLKPFADAQQYSLHVKLADLDLPYYLGYLPESLPLKAAGGRLGIDLGLNYRAADDAKPQLEVSGRLELTGLDLRDRAGRQPLYLPALAVELAPSRPLERHLHLAEVIVERPHLWIDRDSEGAWSFTRLLPPAAPAAPAATTASPFALRIDRLRLDGGRLELHDRLPAGGFRTVLEPVKIGLTGLDLTRERPCDLDLALRSEHGEELTLSGGITPVPLTADLVITAREVPLAAYLPYYRSQLATAIGGRLGLRARVRHSPEQPLLLSDAAAELNGLELPLPAGEGFKLARAELNGGSLDLAARTFAADSLSFSGANLRVSRRADGGWSFLQRGYPLLDQLAGETPATPPPPAPPAAPFAWRLGRISLTGGELTFRDQQPAEPVQVKITALAATVRDLASPETLTANFSLQGTCQNRGQFSLAGTFAPAAPRLDATLQLQRLPLKPFAPYLAARLPVVLADGRLDSRLAVQLWQSAGAWQGRLHGEAGIGRFQLFDATRREELVRWERLQLSGLDLHSQPPALSIAGVALSDYYARVLLDEEGRLNLAELFRQPPPAGGEEPPAAVAPAAGSERPQVRIARVTLQGGRINFTDRHLARPFTADMLDLGGSITGLSSTPGTAATVDLRGRLRNESPLAISGTLNPLAEPLALDLKLAFSAIELSPFSPYSGTYVGYLIERGKLNVDLAYQVANGRLQASNKLFLDQLTFGGQVDSPKATTLPVRLAVALLKDRNGEIHLDIPVWGDLNDPQFSVWRLVWQVLKNLLVKAATSPLALLGGLGGSDDFSSIAFPAGSASLAETEQAKLARIADALRDRPDLRIEVKGYVDPDHDPEGYRRELLDAQLRRARQLDRGLRRAMAAAGRDEQAPLTAEEYSACLWQVYREAAFPKPRNLIGMVSHLPDAEMEKLLLASMTVGREEMEQLAQQRARQVMAALVAAGLAQERLFIGTTVIDAPPRIAGAGRGRVEFGVVVK